MKLILLCVVFLANSLHAQDIHFGIHKHYSSPRALGMGGAFTSVVDDHTAIFYNPAALSKIKEGELKFGIQGAVSKGLLDFIDDLGKATDIPDVGSDREEAVIDVLSKYEGKHLSSRFPTLSTIWARPNWGFAFIPVDLSLDLGLHQSLGPEVSLEVYQDSTFAYGRAWRLKKAKGLTLGATAKAIYRGYIGRDLLAVDLVDGDIIDDEDFKEGFTIDFDVGLLYEPHWWTYDKAVPTFSFVIRNLLNYGFRENFNIFNDNSIEPPKAQRTIDVGSAWQLPQFWVFDPKVSLEIHNIMHDYFSLRKGFHLGAELGWTAFDWLKGAYRLGLHQGYYTAGISGQLKWFKLEAATWGEEVGTSKTKLEDRRYMVQLSLNF